MDFPDFEFDSMNETDIREEIIAPLLRHLGYRSGTDHDIIREQHLSYSRLQLGRQKATDPLLQGKADYICSAGKRVRWVIEAKSPSQSLDAEVERQAWTYAAHPEIRAVYFAVANGREFKLYDTMAGPDAPPAMECKYEDLPRVLAKIENTLAPASVLRDYPDRAVDDGVPLGPGLRSIARITGGQIKYTSITTNHPTMRSNSFRPLIEMVMSITDGHVQRTDDGRIQVSYWTLVPVQTNQRLNQQLGLDQMTMFSPHDTISIDPAAPTVFESSRRVVIPEGTETIDLNTWTSARVPFNIVCDVSTQAIGHLEGRRFTGAFAARMAFVAPAFAVDLIGRFEVNMA